MPLPSGRSLDDVLAATYRRGRRIKARRIALRASPVVAAVLVVAVAVAGALPPRPSGTNVAIPVATAPPDPEAAVPVVTTTSLPVEPTTTSTVPPQPPQEPVAAPPSTLPPLPPPPTECDPALMSFSVTTNAPAYQSGEWVIMVATARNLSGQPCFSPLVNGWYLLNEHGYRVVAGADGDARPVMGPVAPDRSRTFERHWDQQTCNDRQCGAIVRGTYRVEMHWSGGASALSAPFTLG